ncbi:15124_t:CDS:2 [Acaulospora colombiana]|uniref:15124_t:CDS:1 n=1 Tax=Acaulospora colombiana TaxID=27376 RepID=A0ACA9MPZ3_9GLOM|nr:15124_t:CDS:2 [Acaulospora colombiana]
MVNLLAFVSLLAVIPFALVAGEQDAQTFDLTYDSQFQAYASPQDDLRLIQISETEYRWLTEGQILDLIREKVKFMDITDYTELGTIYKTKKKRGAKRFDAAVSVRQFTHRWAQKSIIARFEGTDPEKENEVVIVGAHQDSVNMWMPNFADDDGSGTVTILEAFRVLVEGNFRPERPVEFHWYSAEEGGLLGSQAIALEYEKEGRDVIGMLQNDMTGYVGSKERESFGIVVDYVDSDLTNFLKTLITTYADIPSLDTKCGYACSDHASWSKAGFPSAFAIEGPFNDSNPYIHTVNDLIEHLSFDHMLEFAKEDSPLPACLFQSAETLQDAEVARTKELYSFTLDIEEEGEKISLTLVDSPGFVRDNELRLDVQVTEALRYIESQFDITLAEETKVKRNPKAQDSQIHACLYFIDNTNNGLTDKDVRILKRLTARVNVIPVVAKADLLTTTQLAKLKQAIKNDLKEHSIPVFDFPIDDELVEPEVAEVVANAQSYIPFSLIAPEDADVIDPTTGEKIRGRQYTWGIIDCLNPKHCDFVELRNVLLSSHRKLFKDITLEVFYEQYRTERLMARKASKMITKEQKKKLMEDLSEI